MNRSTQLILAAISIALLAGCALADTIVLNDDTRLVGEIKKTDEGWHITMADGKSIDVKSSQVKKIIVGSDTAKPDQAMSNLQSLRRSVEAVADVSQIVERFKHFIEQNKGTPAANAAQEDLAQWQDRLDRGLVKLGTKWVTAEERTHAADHALDVAEAARQRIAAGRIHDAEPLLQQALDADPNCVPALYLRGVLLYQLHQLPASRKAFESVIVQINDHGPSLNNLSVILSQQNALMPSLNLLDQALAAAPINKVLLDNAAEVLAALQETQRKNPIAQRLYRRFVEQDAKLQEIMAVQGFYRWGSVWIDKAAMQRIKDDEKAVQGKITVAQNDIADSQKKIADIDGQLSTIEASLRSIENQSFFRDSTGNIIHFPYPPIYYSLQANDQRLKSDRTSEIIKIDAAKQRGRAAEAELPKPKFTGVEQLIGLEGTPQMLPPPQAPKSATTEATSAPSTAPATEPTIKSTLEPSSQPSTLPFRA